MYNPWLFPTQLFLFSLVLITFLENSLFAQILCIYHLFIPKLLPRYLNIVRIVTTLALLIKYFVIYRMKGPDDMKTQATCISKTLWFRGADTWIFCAVTSLVDSCQLIHSLPLGPGGLRLVGASLLPPRGAGGLRIWLAVEPHSCVLKTACQQELCQVQIMSQKYPRSSQKIRDSLVRELLESLDRYRVLTFYSE